MMTNERKEEVRLSLIAMKSGDTLSVEGITIKLSSYGYFEVTGRAQKICRFVGDVCKIIDEIEWEDNLSPTEKLRKQFFEDNSARIEKGIIIHRVDHLRLGGDTIRDGVDGSWSEWVPMTRDEADAWCQAHGTTFRELFK